MSLLGSINSLTEWVALLGGITVVLAFLGAVLAMAHRTVNRLDDANEQVAKLRTEDLANLVKSLDGVTAELNKLGGKLDNVTRELAQVDRHVAGHEARLDGVERDLALLKNRVFGAHQE